MAGDELVCPDLAGLSYSLSALESVAHYLACFWYSSLEYLYFYLALNWCFMPYLCSQIRLVILDYSHLFKHLGLFP